MHFGRLLEQPFNQVYAYFVLTTFRLYKSIKDSDLHMHKPFSINQLKLQILVCQGMLQCHTTPSADKAMHETFRQSI